MIPWAVGILGISEQKMLGFSPVSCLLHHSPTPTFHLMLLLCLPGRAGQSWREGTGWSSWSESKCPSLPPAPWYWLGTPQRSGGEGSPNLGSQISCESSYDRTRATCVCLLEICTGNPEIVNQPSKLWGPMLRDEVQKWEAERQGREGRRWGLVVGVDGDPLVPSVSA